MTTRLLMATSNPFWRCDGGSNQRMTSLVRTLAASGIEVHLCQIGPISDRDRAHALNLGLASVEPTHPFGTKLCVPHGKPGPGGHRMDNFICETVRSGFFRRVKQLRPDVVLIQMIRHANLGLDLDKQTRRRTLLAIDTHDVMHKRCKRFHDAGLPHWINIDRDEEARVLGGFDLVLAIQQADAACFRSMLPPATEVLTAPHGIVMPKVLPPIRSPGRCMIGFVGVDSPPNRNALAWMLDHCWMPLRERFGLQIELHIAGTVGKQIPENTPGVRTLGFVENLGSFYDNIDIAVGPIHFGGGLKIKNVEALAYARPLVTTSVGAEGMEDEIGSAMLVADEPIGFVEHIATLIDHPDRAHKLAMCGRAYAESHFSPQAAFAPLVQRLNATRLHRSAS